MISVNEHSNGNLVIQVHPVIVQIITKDFEDATKLNVAKDRFGNTEDSEEQEMLLEYLEQEHKQNITVLQRLCDNLLGTKPVEVTKCEANQLVQVLNYLKVNTAASHDLGEIELDPNYTPSSAEEYEALTKIRVLNVLSYNLLPYLL